VHRDLTPGNLMLVGAAADDTLGATVKILDIGMGRELFEEGAEGDPDFALTNEGDMLGTPLYMAPEQAGDPHGVDIRADLYGLGCVFYHALAGQPPFNEKNKVRLLVRHATETPQPLADFVRDVPNGLQRIVDRLLAKEPARRFPTPREAVDALAPFVVKPIPGDAVPDRPELRAYLGWLEGQTAVVDAEEAEPSPKEPPAAQSSRPAPAKPAGKPQPLPPHRDAEPARAPARRLVEPIKRPNKALDESVLDVEPVLDASLEEIPSVEPIREVASERVEPESGVNWLAIIGIGVGILVSILLGIVIVLLLVR
jgi:serine/threonine protein kinase